MRLPNLSKRTVTEYASVIRNHLEDIYPDESYIVRDLGRSEVRMGDTNYFDTAIVLKKTKVFGFPVKKTVAKITLTSHYSSPDVESVRAEIGDERIPKVALQEIVEMFSFRGQFVSHRN